MLQGIEIMLERMKTHPEEFIVDDRYTQAFHKVMPYLSDEEKGAVKQALSEAHRQFFTGEVMSIMAGEQAARHPATMSQTLSDYVNGEPINTYTQDMSRSTGTFHLKPSAVRAEGAFVETIQKLVR